MKKWLVLLLLFITAAGTFVPCCGIDDCCSENIAANRPNEHRKERSCAPLFACASCPASAEVLKPMQLKKPMVDKQVHHEPGVAYNLATFSTTFWQPPRVNYV